MKLKKLKMDYTHSVLDNFFAIKFKYSDKWGYDEFIYSFPDKEYLAYYKGGEISNLEYDFIKNIINDFEIE